VDPLLEARAISRSFGIAIVISSLPSAAAGVLFALNSGFIDPNIALGVERSLLPPLMALMGGTDHPDHRDRFLPLPAAAGSVYALLRDHLARGGPVDPGGTVEVSADEAPGPVQGPGVVDGRALILEEGANDGVER